MLDKAKQKKFFYEGDGQDSRLSIDRSALLIE